MEDVGQQPAGFLIGEMASVAMPIRLPLAPMVNPAGSAASCEMEKGRTARVLIRKSRPQAKGWISGSSFNAAASRRVPAVR